MQRKVISWASPQDTCQALIVMSVGLIAECWNRKIVPTCTHNILITLPAPVQTHTHTHLKPQTTFTILFPTTHSFLWCRMLEEIWNWRIWTHLNYWKEELRWRCTLMPKWGRGWMVDGKGVGRAPVNGREFFLVKQLFMDTLFSCFSISN